jgi:hypothetical protein
VTARAPEDFGHAERKVDADRKRAEYEARKAAGICVRAESHGPAEPGSVLCAPCQHDRRQDVQDRYRRNHKPQRRIECQRCGTEGHNARTCRGVPLPDWSPVNRRYEKNTAYKANLKARGFCVGGPNHEKPRPGLLRCETCLAKRRKATS